MQPECREMFLKTYFSSSLEEKEAVSESESGGSEDHSDRQHHDRHGQSPPAHHYPHHSGIRVLPSGALISNGGTVTNMDSLHTLSMSGPPNGGTVTNMDSLHTLSMSG